MFFKNSIDSEPTYLDWNPEVKCLKINFTKSISGSQLDEIIKTIKKMNHELNFEIGY